MESNRGRFHHDKYLGNICHIVNYFSGSFEDANNWLAIWIELDLIFGQVASCIVITMTWPPLGGDYYSMIIGVWYVSNVSTFPNAFPLVLDSNLHDLNETNPGLTLFSAELPWCCFCAEIKVLGMEQNIARNFYIIYKNYGSQDLPERGPWVGTTHQGAPPLLARPGGLSPPGGPANPKTDAIKSYFSRQIKEK